MKQEIYAGSKKIIYKAPEENEIILSFTDYIKFTENKTLEISGKGVINNSISAFIMRGLEMIGVETHFIKKLNMREQLVQVAEVLPIKISISAVACDRYVSEFKIEEGYVFDFPVIEFKIKNRGLKYPVINEDQIINFGWLNSIEIKEMKTTALKIHDFLSGLFLGLGIRLVQCNLELGQVYNGEDISLILVDEVTPDNCKLWDINTNEKLGLEGAIKNKSDKLESYQKIFNRLTYFSKNFQ